MPYNLENLPILKFKLKVIRSKMNKDIAPWSRKILQAFE